MYYTIQSQMSFETNTINVHDYAKIVDTLLKPCDAHAHNDENLRVDIKIYDRTNPNGIGKVRHTVTITNGIETDHKIENINDDQAQTQTVIVGKNQVVNNITFEIGSLDWRQFLLDN